MEKVLSYEDIIKYCDLINEVNFMISLKGYDSIDVSSYKLLKYVGEKLEVMDKLQHFLMTDEDIQVCMEEELNYYDSYSDYEFDEMIARQTKENEEFKDICIDDLIEQDEKLTEKELELVDEVKEIFYDILGTKITKRSSNKKKEKIKE